MHIRTLRAASLAMISFLLSALVFVNIFVGNTLSSFSFLVFIVGLMLVIIGVFIWVFCSFLEHNKSISPLGLYLVYGGVAFLILGAICSVIIPAIHSFGQPWVLPD